MVGMRGAGYHIIMPCPINNKSSGRRPEYKLENSQILRTQNERIEYPKEPLAETIKQW